MKQKVLCSERNGCSSECKIVVHGDTKETGSSVPRATFDDLYGRGCWENLLSLHFMILE